MLKSSKPLIFPGILAAIFVLTFAGFGAKAGTTAANLSVLARITPKCNVLPTAPNADNLNADNVVAESDAATVDAPTVACNGDTPYAVSVDNGSRSTASNSYPPGHPLYTGLIMMTITF